MIELEPITPTNAQVYKNLRLRALLDSPTAFSSTYADAAKLSDDDWLQRAAHWSSRAAVAYLAIDAGDAVGMAAGVLGVNDPRRAELLSMWVAPSHRRSGIGRLLVDTIAAWARARNVLHLYLSVTSNNDQAIQFYRSLGFTLTDRRETYPNDPALCNLAMLRALT